MNVNKETTNLEKSGLLCNWKFKIKKIINKNHNISKETLETKEESQNLPVTPRSLSKEERRKKDLEKFANALYANATAHINSIG